MTGHRNGAEALARCSEHGIRDCWNDRHRTDFTEPACGASSLQEVRLDQPITAQVTVELAGDSAGVKEGGVLSQVNRMVNVEALPMEVPDKLVLDVSAMEIGDTLRLSDLRAPEGARLLDDPETVLATVTMPTRVVEPEVEEGEEVEGEVPEGEEAPEGAAEAPPEPEAGAGTGESGEPGTVEG